MKLVAPVALITSLILGAFGVPGKIRLAVSAPALAQAGKRVLEGEEPKTARLYGFRETREQHGCAILTTQAIFIDEYGWAYCPQGPPPAYSKETFLPVGRDLYRYTFAD